MKRHIEPATKPILSLYAAKVAARQTMGLLGQRLKAAAERPGK